MKGTRKTLAGKNIILGQRCAELERKVDALLRKNEELEVALATERQMAYAAARRASWGNGAIQ